jgi:hypothetical protein
MSEGRSGDLQRTWGTEIFIQTRDCKQIRRINVVLSMRVRQDTVKMVVNNSKGLNLSGLG